MIKRIIKYFFLSFFLVVFLIIGFFSFMIGMSYLYEHLTKESYSNHHFILKQKMNFNNSKSKIKVDLSWKKEFFKEYRYTLKILPNNNEDNIIYGFTLKEEDTLKTIYGIEKLISPANIELTNLYLRDKIYLLEVKFYYSNTSNDIFVYNYEIVPKDKLKDWF